MKPTPVKIAPRSWRIGRSGEVMLACGFILTLVSALLLQQVMIGLLGIIIAPVALGFLLVGVLRARGRSEAAHTQVVGLIFILAGIVALVWVTFGAAGMGARLALQAQRVQQGSHLLDPAAGFGNPLQPIGAIVAPILFGFGLRFWGAWSSLRYLAWSGILVAVVPTIHLYFRVMGPRLVLSA